MSFLQSITDTTEQINQYMDNVSLHPLDITQSDFKQWIEWSSDFELKNLEMFGEKMNLL